MGGYHQTNLLRTTVGPVASGNSSSVDDNNQNNCDYPIETTVNLQPKDENGS